VRLSVQGVGASLPARRVDNREVAELVGLEPGRIAELFGVTERRWVRQDEGTTETDSESVSTLAAQAGRRALEDAGVVAKKLDAVIAVSMTPEYISPPLDFLIRRDLGVAEGLGFSLQAACTGIFRAVLLAEGLLSTGRAATVLIVAADAGSPYFVFDRNLPKDLRMSMALYGDGAGAMVLAAGQGGLARIESPLAVSTASDQSPGILLRVATGGRNARRKRSACEGIAYHDFRRVLELGGPLTRRAADAVLNGIGLKFDDVDHLLIHQATGNMKRIISSLGMPAEKLHLNIDHVGNTLSPSTLILLDELKREHTFQAGDLLLMASAESATWSYGGMALRWN